MTCIKDITHLNAWGRHEPPLLPGLQSRAAGGSDALWTCSAVVVRVLSGEHAFFLFIFIFFICNALKLTFSEFMN